MLPSRNGDLRGSNENRQPRHSTPLLQAIGGRKWCARWFRTRASSWVLIVLPLEHVLNGHYRACRVPVVNWSETEL